jgi:hypothetical protein
VLQRPVNLCAGEHAAVDLALKVQVFRGAELIFKTRRVAQIDQPGPPSAWVQSDICTAPMNGTVLQFGQAADHAQQGCLARAIGTLNMQALSRQHLEVEVRRKAACRHARRRVAPRSAWPARPQR